MLLLLFVQPAQPEREITDDMGRRRLPELLLLLAQDPKGLLMDLDRAKEEEEEGGGYGYYTAGFAPSLQSRIGRRVCASTVVVVEL